VNGQLGAVVAVSSAARDAMISRTGFPEDRIIHVPNGIEPPVMPSAAKIAAIRAELKVSPQTPLVVTVARLAAEKGIELWIDAVAQIKKILPDVRFVVVGEGPRKQDILSRMADRGVTEMVFLVGFRSDATDWIAAGDLFVLPSPAEPFGLVLLEAMALGKPVVACGAAGPLDIITDGSDGVLAAPDSATALAEAVLGLLGDPRRADRIAEAGKATFNRRFTADRMADELMKVYRFALEKADRSRINSS
jgi:glycosyltransferase involved in cell wall biosynthesis